MSIKEQHITLLGKNVNYASAGQGSPMIFLHNGGGFWQCWYYQMKHFKNTHTVFGIDWPNFGESDSCNKMISLELLTNTLDEFIRTLRLENVILVGNCIGASVALNYTNKYPDKVSRLILMNICPGRKVFANKYIRSLIPSLNKHPKRKKIAESVLKFAFTKTPLKRKFPAILFGNNPDKVSFLYKKYQAKFKEKKQTEARLNLVFSVHTFDIELFMNQESIPKHLLLWGIDNKTTPYESHGKYHIEFMKSDNFIAIPKGGHLCMYEYPEKVNQIIEKYINSSVT
jgi:pimeloyl-ACP methyl ester carboxylesterase